MNQKFNAPVAIRHKGKAIYFVSGYDEDSQIYKYFYNVLNTEITSSNDSLDWEGCFELSFPQEISLAGYNILRVKKQLAAQKFFQVLSDEKYVYIFRAAENAVYVNRYLMVEVPNPNIQGKTRIELQSAWEVRYQRSGKPDTPASDKDTQNFINVEGAPFVEPILEIPLYAEQGPLNITEGSFTVSLIPTSISEKYRWQFFITDINSGCIYTYSIPRSDNGWFDFTDEQLSKEAKAIKPDVKLILTKNKMDLTVSGLPAAVVYTKQEPMSSSNNAVLKMQCSYRMMLTVQVIEAQVNRWLSTLDFAVSSEGTLACLKPQSDVKKLEVGEIKSAEYVLRFNNYSWVSIPRDSNPIILGNAFTQQAWLFSNIDDLERHCLFGTDAVVEEKDLPPSVWVSQKLCIEVGFGNGTRFLRRQTGNVLKQNAWNNIAVLFENSTFKIYINGFEVEHEGDDFTGQTPASTPLSTIGGHQGYFIGDLDEVRVWNSAQYDSVKNYLYSEIPGNEITESMQGYWRLDDGSGKIARNLAPHAGRDGLLSGSQWVAATAPLNPAAAPVVHFDEDSLTLYAGVIIPENNAEFPNFGKISEGSRPYILSSSDGLLHLYYQGTDNSLLAAQYDTSIARANYGIAWKAQVPETADEALALLEEQKGNLIFSARQIGTILNNAVISFEKDNQTSLYKAELNDNKGGSEIWKGLSEKITYITAVLAGQSVDDPLDYRLKTGECVFYDYSGKRNLSFMPIGNSLLHGKLLFVSRNIGTYVFKEAVVTLQDNTDFCSVKLTGNLTEQAEDGIFFKTLKNVPADIYKFVETLNGIYSQYDYNDLNNTNADETMFYAIEAATSQIMVIIPDTHVVSMQMTIQGTSDPDKCKVNVILTLADKSTQSGSWDNVPRITNEFIKTVTESSQPVAAYLKFYATNEENLVNDCALVPQANLQAICSFVDVFNLEASGKVENFTCVLSKAQGVTSSKNTVITNRGSAIFSVYADYVPDNGYPAVIDTGAGVKAVSVLLKPGQDGGWIAESPQNCIEISKNRSGIKVELDPIFKKPLDIKGSMSLEAWINAKPPSKSERGIPAIFPRVIHSNSVPELYGSKYMLGIAYSNAMQFLRGTKIEITDTDINDDVLKLFNVSSIWTIQCYVKADLNTPIDVAGRIFQKTSISGGTPSELLTVDKNGILTYKITPIPGREDPIEVCFNNKLLNETWTSITIARRGAEVKLYFNNSLDITIAAAPLTADSHSRLLLGDNNQAQALEMEMNQLAIWNDRALTNEDIEIFYQKPIPSDDEKLVLLWRMDEYRSDNKIINDALSTGSKYDTIVQGNYFWEYPGMFCRAFGAVRNTAVQSKEAIISGNAWNHLALIYNCHYGIGLSNNAYADCGNNDSLNVQDEFSVEAWVNVKAAASSMEQIILSKYGSNLEDQSYEIGLDSKNRPFVKVRLAGVKDHEGNLVKDDKLYFTCTANKEILLDTSCFLAAALKITCTNLTENNETVTISNLNMNLYVNGDLVAKFVSENLYGSVSFNQSSANVNLGRTKPDGKSNEQAYFQGELSDVAIWNTALSADAIKEDFELKEKFKSRKGLISYWNFKEQEGRVAFDSKSDNHAFLSTSELWIAYHESSTYQLLINGTEVPMVKKSAFNFGGYEKEQLAFGSMRNKDNAFVNTFLGQLDEIRIWNHARTYEQITDNLYNYLKGNEKGLMGYWKFDAGTGDIIVDQTGNGNNGIFDAFVPEDNPMWQSSTAPISNEAPGVLNVLGGLRTEFLTQVNQGIAAVEYSDTQIDSEGEMFSVLKRCYIYASLENGAIKEITGYKVGDLLQVYLGQVQTRPSLIGYIEGAPPLPSENLTRPFYEDPTKPSYLGYYNSSSVKLTASKSGKISFSSSRTDDSNFEFDFKIGPAVGKKIETKVGVPPAEVITRVVEVESKVLGGTNIKRSESENNGKGVNSSIMHTSSNYMYNCGDWEFPNSNGAYYLHTGERRFIPNNEGYALVKSSTADMYSLYLQNTGALVGITIVPNTDIPEDINIIYFPINPKYTKNGTLDGKLGLQNDPDFPEADVKRCSYFKAIEAYNIKKRIEKGEQELMASYAQFNAAKRGKAKNQDLSQVLNDNPLYNWNTDTPKKDMVSTYVWTAAGGLYSEQKGYLSMIQEVQSGAYNFAWSAGIKGELKLLVNGWGLYTEANIMGGTQYTITVEKNKEEESALQLEVSADPDGFLSKYLGREQPNNICFSQDPVPGKVDSYRFMTFYLSPKNNNFDEFFNNVVDQAWLNTSADPRAAALREAKSNTNPCWRVMHRVTFVGRIPPKFQAFSLASQAPSISAPTNLEANTFMLDMVMNRLKDHPLPTPAEIGNAVRNVITQDLKIAVPWWEEYLSAAQAANSDENLTVNSLIQDTISYVNQYYASKAYQDN